MTPAGVTFRNGSIAVTKPPGSIVADATPLASVVVADTSDESAFWKYTRTSGTFVVPDVIVNVTTPEVGASGAGASWNSGASGRLLTSPSSPHATRNKAANSR